MLFSHNGNAEYDLKRLKLSPSVSNAYKPKCFQQLGLALCLISGSLLAIWAMQHTVALRNMLLGLGFLLAAIYFLNVKNGSLNQIPWPNLLPILLIGGLFLWVILHYFFFSQDSAAQLKELSSIWLRSALGAVLGLATGLAVSSKPHRINLLGFGIVGGFLALYCQYIPRVWVSHQLFQVDYFNYVFYGKINGVLMGTLLIAGIGGTLMDAFRLRGGASYTFFATALILTILPLYAYVFLFSAKNGIGSAVVLGIFWSIWALCRLRKKVEQTPKTVLPKKNKVLAVLVLISLLALVSAFARMQIRHDPSWLNLVEDIHESVQIDKYPQWKSPATMGYPILASGRMVTPNAFERVSWATAGLRLIPQNPWGNGILQYPFRRSLAPNFPDLDPNILPGSTHSGWLELTLSFGLPALFFLWGSLASIFLLALKNKEPHQGLVISLVFAIFCLYSVGELSNHHAVEILIFSMALLAGINMPKPNNLHNTGPSC